MQNDFKTAADRSCDNQKNNCAELANNGEQSFEVGDCDRQNGAFSTPLARELHARLSCVRIRVFGC